MFLPLYQRCKKTASKSSSLPLITTHVKIDRLKSDLFSSIFHLTASERSNYHSVKTAMRCAGDGRSQAESGRSIPNYKIAKQNAAGPTSLDARHKRLCLSDLILLQKSGHRPQRAQRVNLELVTFPHSSQSMLISLALPGETAGVRPPTCCAFSPNLGETSTRKRSRIGVVHTPQLIWNHYQ